MNTPRNRSSEADFGFLVGSMRVFANCVSGYHGAMDGNKHWLLAAGLFTLALVAWPEQAYSLGTAVWDSVFTAYLVSYVDKASWAFTCF